MKVPKSNPTQAPSGNYDRETVLQRYRRTAERALDGSGGPSCSLLAAPNQTSGDKTGGSESGEPGDGSALCEEEQCRACCTALVAHVERAAEEASYTTVELGDTLSRAHEIE